MSRITLYIRNKKKDAQVKLRFRLTQGRNVSLCHATDIHTTMKDLDKFTIDCNLKPKVALYNRELKTKIDAEVELMSKAFSNLSEKYDSSTLTSELFEKEIGKLRNADRSDKKIVCEPITARYERFITDSYKAGIFGENRYRHYRAVLGSLSRFLEITHQQGLPVEEFTDEHLADLRSFFANEYMYVKDHPNVFASLKPRDIPTAKRHENTVITRMKKLQAFFNYLVERREIAVSPFTLLGKNRKANMMRSRFDPPRFLRIEELHKIKDTSVPDNLIAVKDAFLVQCALGCRISDFKRMTMQKIHVSEEGIPFVSYLPQKTLRENNRLEEVQTPLLRFALEIIKEHNFVFPILKNETGTYGYNFKIRALLQYCGIDRPVKRFNEAISDNEELPLWYFGSSKLARSTFVDIMSKVQINPYVAGVHKIGSKAVDRYYELELKDRNALMCLAFSQPSYKTDKDLNILEP